MTMWEPWSQIFAIVCHTMPCLVAIVYQSTFVHYSLSLQYMGILTLYLHKNTCSCGHTMHFTYRKWFNLGKLTSNHQGKSYLGLSISPGEKRMKDQTGEVNMWGCLKFSSYFPATSNATDFNKWGFLDGFNREVLRATFDHNYLWARQ